MPFFLASTGMYMNTDPIGWASASCLNQVTRTDGTGRAPLLSLPAWRLLKTADELADILAVSRITIFKQAKAGRIPSFRIGTCVRFDPRAVANWLRTQ
jgi:excisionase family DNA binding protein